MHLEHLCERDKQRYKDKITVNGILLRDPFQITEKEWINDPSLRPPVQFGDIWNYLVNTPGQYTAESLRAYKSLDGYNFFVSGHVRDVWYRSVSESVCYLKSFVLPSQKAPERKNWHECWVCLEKKEGSIFSAHCTCKAG